MIAFKANKNEKEITGTDAKPKEVIVSVLTGKTFILEVVDSKLVTKTKSGTRPTKKVLAEIEK